MRNLSPAVLTIFLAGTALSQQPEPAAPLASVVLPPELDRVLRDYERAWQAHDPTALAELFSQDGFVLASGRPPVRGRAAIRAAYSGSGGPLSLRAFAYATADDLGYIIGGFGPKANAADSGKFVLTLKRGADALAHHVRHGQSQPAAPMAAATDPVRNPVHALSDTFPVDLVAECGRVNENQARLP
jgi:ketosteroid isomerase-like protein